MFVLKSTHEARVKGLNEREQWITRLYERHIDELNSQISYLRKLVFPEVSALPNPVAREADAVMSASDKPPEMSEADHNAMIEGMREADRLMSGNYDEEVIG